MWARAALFRRLTDADAYGTGSVKIRKTRHNISVDGYTDIFTDSVVKKSDQQRLTRCKRKQNDAVRLLRYTRKWVIDELPLNSQRPKSKGTGTRFRALPVIGEARRRYQSTREVRFPISVY